MSSETNRDVPRDIVDNSILTLGLPVRKVSKVLRVVPISCSLHIQFTYFILKSCFCSNSFLGGAQALFKKMIVLTEDYKWISNLSVSFEFEKKNEMDGLAALRGLIWSSP